MEQRSTGATSSTSYTSPTTVAATDLALHPAIRTLSLALRLLLATVFLIAGVEKLIGFNTFARNIAAYEMLPDALVNIVALSFIWTEIVVGVLFYAGAAIRGSALVTSAMLVLFLIAILSAMARGMTIDCGCGGGLAEPVGWKKVIEDVGLLTAAISLIYFPKSYFMIGDVLGKDEGASTERGPAEGRSRS